VIEPDFLTLEDVLWIHQQQLELYGGQAGVRDQGLLESAIGMPRQTFGGDFVHDELFAMAAAYAFHIAENQPFIDANKRTALEACVAFLDLNGIVILDPDGKLYDAMMGLATRSMTTQGMADLLRKLPRGDEESDPHV
jgi:death-on-curing protein